MIKENKDLLLKYLCMALPYGIKVWYKYYPTNITENFATSIRLADNKIDLSNKLNKEGDWHPIEEAKEILIKPYLRSMSSMTKEEMEEMHNLLSPEGTAIYGNDGIALPINHCCEFVPYEFMNRIIQYLLKKHFDFMGLIPKCLAIEVTEENNPY